MARGRHSYPKVKVVCNRCGWSGLRSTFMADKACPKCLGYGSIKIAENGKGK